LGPLTQFQERPVLKRILPERIDNRYRGHRLALWLFVVVALQKLGLSLAHLFKADGGAQSVSTIPLDSYPPGAAQNIIGLFARMGLEQLLLAALFVLVLVRYRAMIPLMYVVVIVHYLGSRGVGLMKPLVLAGTSGARTPALVIAGISAIGLVLSLIGRRYTDTAESK
jgi:hypothetical protein